MTDASPKATLALDAVEWQTLAVTNVNRLSQFLSQIPAPTDESLAAIDQHIVRFRAMLQAWRRAAPPVAAQQPEVEMVAERQPSDDSVQRASNGAGKPKRKGGWPKGKTRTPRQPAQVQ